MQLVDLKEPNAPDLRTLEVGSVVVTTKGFQWKLVSRTEEGETWEDFVSGLTWLPATDEQVTWGEAMAKQNGVRRLPTKEEYEEAEKHGIREILEIDGRWWWSSSWVPGYSDYAYLFCGYNGHVSGQGNRNGIVPHYFLLRCMSENEKKAAVKNGKAS